MVCLSAPTSTCSLMLPTAEYEHYRNNPSRNSAEIKDHVDAAALQALEPHKYLRKPDTYKDRLEQLEAKLGVAQQVTPGESGDRAPDGGRKSCNRRPGA